MTEDLFDIFDLITPRTQVVAFSKTSRTFVFWDGETKLRLCDFHPHESGGMVNVLDQMEIGKNEVPLTPAHRLIFTWRATHCDSCHDEFTQKELDGGRCACGHMISNPFINDP